MTRNDLASTVDSKGRLKLFHTFKGESYIVSLSQEHTEGQSAPSFQDRHKHVKTPWRHKTTMKRADIIYGYLCLCLCTLQMFWVTQWSGCITYCCSGFGIFLANDGCFVSLWRRGFWWFWCNNSGIIWSWLAKHCWLTCKSQMCVSVCTGEWM